MQSTAGAAIECLQIPWSRGFLSTEYHEALERNYYKMLRSQSDYSLLKTKIISRSLASNTFNQRGRTAGFGNSRSGVAIKRLDSTLINVNIISWCHAHTAAAALTLDDIYFFTHLSI